MEKKRIRAQQIRAQSFVLNKIKKKMNKREQRKREKRCNFVKSMEFNSKKAVQKFKEDKQNYLRLSEWFTIQNELSVLAQKQSEMKRLNREQRLLKKRIRNKEDQYNEIAKSRLVDSDYNY